MNAPSMRVILVMQPIQYCRYIALAIAALTPVSFALADQPAAALPRCRAKAYLLPFNHTSIAMNWPAL